VLISKAELVKKTTIYISVSYQQKIADAKKPCKTLILCPDRKWFFN
jgi:hypothetical protein